MNFFTLVLPLTFFHFYSQRLGVVCVMFYNVLCCLNFGIWIQIIEFYFFPFFFLFPHLSPSFSHFFPPFMLISFASCLIVASSFCCALCCLKLLPHHLVMLFHCIALSLFPQCFIALIHYVASSRCHMLRRTTFSALSHCLIHLLRCLITLAFHFFMQFHYFTCFLSTSLPWLATSPCCHGSLLSKYFMNPPPRICFTTSCFTASLPCWLVCPSSFLFYKEEFGAQSLEK